MGNQANNVTVAPELVVKIVYEDSAYPEKTIGYATGLSYQVSQGQKEIYVVDSPFPAEIAQSASPIAVKGGITLFLPRGYTLESLGLVPYRLDAAMENAAATSRYCTLKVYDRATGSTVVSFQFCKVSDYKISIQARSIVRCELSFTAMFAVPGGVI